MAALRKLLERLASPPETTRAANLRRWAATVPGVTPIADLRPRSRAKTAGVVQNIRIDPREGAGSIEATLIDGTGQMVAKWLGRPSLSGIKLGVGLIVEGTVALSRDGECLLLNPEYDLVPGPEHG